MHITKERIINLGLVFIFLVQVLAMSSMPFAAEAVVWENMEGADEIAAAFDTDPANPVDIRVLVARYIFIFLGFMGIVFVVILVSAGIKWMTAGGNETAVSQARSMLQVAVIGLTIILSAWAISFYVTNVLYDATSAP